MEEQKAPLQQGSARTDATKDQTPPPPWRTEGLPEAETLKKRPPWVKWVWWLLLYGGLFAILTMQDRLGSPLVVPYTEFKAQIASKNVKEIFAKGNSVQGVLKASKPVPGHPGIKYSQFVTERPTFATDNLLSELDSNGATVQARPLVQERGFLANLLISVAPMIVMIGLWSLILKRQQNSMGGLGGLFGGRETKPVDPHTVRVTFDDVAGIDKVKAGDQRDRQLPEGPGKISPLGRPRAQGCAPGWCTWHRQDSVSAGDRGRGQSPLLQR